MQERTTPTSINHLKQSAESLPDYSFLVTHIGGDSEYYSPPKIAPMFAKAKNLPNVHLPAEYWQVLNNRTEWD